MRVRALALVVLLAACSPPAPSASRQRVRGVRGNEVTVAFHWNRDSCGADVSERLTNFGSDPMAAISAYVDYLNAHSEARLGGRRITPIYVASGGGDHAACDERSRAAAIEIAERHRAFAAVGSGLSYDEDVLAPELARRGVFYVGRVFGTEASFAATDPYAWSALPTASVVVRELAAFATRLASRGGPAGHTRFDGRRVFGVLHQDTAAARAVVGELTAALGKTRVAASVAYSLDLSTAARQSAAAVGRFQAAGVNTLLMLTEPLAPIYFTSAAARAGYDPDYVVSSYGYLDRPAAVVNYSRPAVRHWYGVSLVDADTQRSVTEERDAAFHRAYVEVRPGQQPPADAAAWFTAVDALARAIAGAGATLSARSAADALRAAAFDGHGPAGSARVVTYDPDDTDTRDPKNFSGRRRGRFHPA